MFPNQSGMPRQPGSKHPTVAGELPIRAGTGVHPQHSGQLQEHNVQHPAVSIDPNTGNHGNFQSQDQDMC